MEDDWDLQAVVRGCSTASSAATATTSCSQFCGTFDEDRSFWAQGFHPLHEEDLREKTLFSETDLFSPQCLPISNLSVLGGLQDLMAEQQQRCSLKQNTRSQTKSSHYSTSRMKRRKNHSKRVCNVPVESLSSDLWSWRKYGQKPIKGSPFPRGYYRCSTLKGCMARKQVERNKSNPGMFIVTYTGEHSHPMPKHRSSQPGGGVRQKQENSSPYEPPSKPVSSPALTTEETFSPLLEKLTEADDEDDEFRVSDAALDEDFFAGLDDLTCPPSGDFISDQFPFNLQFPWLVHLATATTAAGGS